MTTEPISEVMTSTTFDLPGFDVERTLGVTWGLVVRSTGFTKGFTGGIRSLKAGEVAQFSDVVDSARRTGVDRMMTHAAAQGANAVLGVQFDSSDVGDRLAEVVAYGTAAVVSPRR